jgi:hypothetical protein
LQENGARVAVSDSGTAPMAVGAYNLAFLNLTGEIRERSIGDAPSDIERLIPQVIELEDGSICLSTVHARMRAKEVVQKAVSLF